MDLKQKREYLSGLKEKEFRLDVAVPLLRKIKNIDHVTDIHGRNEAGVDIVYFESDALRFNTCVGVQLKADDINFSEGKNATVHDIEKQIAMASRGEYSLASPAGKHKISKYIVMTTRTISERAREELSKIAYEYKLNVQFIEGEKVIEYIDESWPDFWEYLDKKSADYLYHMQQKYSDVEEMIKLGVKKAKKFNEIYVNTQLQEMVDEKAILESGDTLTSSSPEIIEDIELLNRENLIIVIGSSGSGKKLLLRKLLFESIKRSSYRLPFLVDAVKIDTQINALDNLRSILKKCDGGHIAEDIENELISNGALILIDQLSRIADHEKVIDVINMFTDLSAKYAKIKIIVSIRDNQIFETTSMTKFKRYQILNFGQRHVESLVSKWYANMETSNSIDVVVEQVLKNVMQSALPHTPLVYTLNLVLLETQPNTANLADVFDKYIDLYLGKWNEEFNIVSEYDFMNKRNFLSELSYYMLSNKTDRLTDTEIADFFDGLFRRMDREGSGRNMLSEILKGGILIQENGYIKFPLYALQEWFAGYYMQRKLDEQSIISKLDDRYWGQAIIFYSGLRRECDYILENLYTQKEVEEFGIQFYRSYLSGMIAVNADESSGFHKKEALRYAMYGYILFLRRLSYFLRRSVGQVGEIYAGMFMDILVYFGLGSNKLANQYRELLNENNFIKNSNLKFNATENELVRFFLASIMTRMNMDGYKIYMDDIIKTSNPYILLLGYIRMNHMIELNTHIDSKRNLEDLKYFRREMKRKFNRNTEARDKIMARNRRLAKSDYILPSVDEIIARPDRVIDIISNNMENN